MRSCCRGSRSYAGDGAALISADIAARSLASKHIRKGGDKLAINMAANAGLLAYQYSANDIISLAVVLLAGKLAGYAS